jgi:hypothetical protein
MDNKNLLQDYLHSINNCSNELKKKERRKMAIVALLSHWQTLICNEVQLADNILAQKYKYNAGRSASAMHQTPENNNNIQWTSSSTKLELKETKDQRTSENKDKKKEGVAKPQQKVEPEGVARAVQERQRSETPPTPLVGATIQVANTTPTAAPAAVPFHPGHRRGPSTATQMTAGESEPRKFRTNCGKSKEIAPFVAKSSAKSMKNQEC